MDRQSIDTADQTLGSVADVARQDTIDIAGASGGTTAVGDPTQARLSGSSEGDEPIMRDRLHEELEGRVNPGAPFDDEAGVLPKGGVPT